MQTMAKNEKRVAEVVVVVGPGGEWTTASTQTLGGQTDMETADCYLAGLKKLFKSLPDWRKPITKAILLVEFK